jgi:hypothetical protein
VFPFLVAMLCGWLQREQEDAIAFLREENRVLKARLDRRRLRFDDHERRRLAERGHRLGRRAEAWDRAEFSDSTPSESGWTREGLRGGWYSLGDQSRAAFRHRCTPLSLGFNIGFCVACTRLRS